MTFQNWQEFFAPISQNPEKGKYFVFEPAHEEEILNWLKREDISKSEKDNFIKALINFKDRCGGFYQYRGYFLAAKFINIFKNSNFADQIVENLLSWSYDYFPQNEKNIDLERKLAKQAQKALENTDSNRVVTAFVNLIETTENETVLLTATQKLIELAPDNNIALSNLVKILHNTQDKKVIFQIINPLFKSPTLRQKTTEVITETLIRLLKEIKSGDRVEDFWIGNTFFYLKQIAVGNQNAIDELIKLMERLPKGYPYDDEYLCEYILETLGKIGKNNHSAIEALTKFLSYSTKDSLSCLAARGLWFINPGNLLAVDTCVQLLETSRDAFVIHNAALFLLKEEISEFTPTEKFTTKAINSLLNFIKNEQWIDVCGESIATLEKISPNNKTVLQGLFQLLDTVEDKGISLAVAQSILRLDAENEKALTVFEQALATTEDEWRLYNIAKALLNIDPNNEKALEIYYKLLTKSKHEQTRLEISKWLINLDASNQIAIDTLCDLIYMPKIHKCFPEKELALPI